eukprot:1379458-Amphidinium_carterae.1
MFFSVPIERAAVANPWVQLHFLELLSVTEQIKAIDMTFITSPCQQLLEVCNPSIHGSIWSPTGEASIWSETWDESHEIAKDSTAVFITAGYTTINNSRFVPFDVFFYDLPGILQRAEWIRFAAL